MRTSFAVGLCTRFCKRSVIALGYIVRWGTCSRRSMQFWVLAAAINNGAPRKLQRFSLNSRFVLS